MQLALVLCLMRHTTVRREYIQRVSTLKARRENAKRSGTASKSRGGGSYTFSREQRVQRIVGGRCVTPEHDSWRRFSTAASRKA